MNLTASINKRLLKKKIATAVLVTASLAAFATLGDGGKKGDKTLPGSEFTLRSRNFSLRSGYAYKSNDLFAPAQPQFISLNAVSTYQKGSHTYVVPVKKMLLLNKIKFNPAQ